MTVHTSNFLPQSRPISESFLKARVSDIISCIQRDYEMNDRQLSEVVFCSAETITNARNGDNKLSAHTLFNLLLVSPSALEDLLHHFGRRSAPMYQSSDSNALTSAAAAVHKLAVASEHNGPNDRDCLEMEAVVDAAIEGMCAIKSRCLGIRKARAA